MFQTNNRSSWVLLASAIIVGFVSIFLVPSTSNSNVILHIRLPRVLEAWTIGAGLAVAGLAYQSAFKNPVVSPSILGVSFGAGVGAALAFLMGLGHLVPVSSAVYGMLTVAIVWSIANAISKDTASLLIIGVIVSGVSSSILSLIKFVADPEGVLPAITYWLLGSFSTARLTHIWVLICILIIIGLFYRFRWLLDILSTPSALVASAGLDERKAIAIVVVGATLISALSTSIAGVVSMIGLAIPHAVRAWRGTDSNLDIMGDTVLLGGLFALVLDTVIRMLPLELPVGVLTNLCGAFIFGFALLVLRRGVGRD